MSTLSLSGDISTTLVIARAAAVRGMHAPLVLEHDSAVSLRRFCPRDPSVNRATSRGYDV
jgi:hypothetical protein